VSEKTGGTDYEKLGKTVEKLLVNDYIHFLGSTRKQIWGSFVRGIFAGLGGVIGASLVVALLLFVLRYLGGAPVVGHFFQTVSHNIHTGK
jgi:hypothetical protein